MKIIKRFGKQPFSSLADSLSTVSLYLCLKFAGVPMSREWYFYIAIPLPLIIWFFINFKIIKK